MVTKIFKVFLVAAMFAAFSAVSLAQEPFDSLPADSPLQIPTEDTDPEDEQAMPGDDSASPDDPMGFGQDDTEQTPFSADQPSPFSSDEPDQKVVVTEKFAGWQAAGEGSNGERLSDTLRANWVMVDPNGLLEGTVRAVDGANTGKMMVYLLNRGRLVTNDLTDDNGNFELSNVIEGAYSLVGIGDNAFFAFAFNVLHHTEQDDSTSPTRIDVTAFQNKTTINNDWIRHFGPMLKFRVFGRYTVGEDDSDPAKFYGFQGLAEHQPASVPATSINSHKVVKASDGRLLGRVHQLNSLTGRPVNVRNTKVMLLKGDAVAASTETDNYGVFDFEGVAAGQYALVAAGVDGLGCIGIDVVESGMNSLIGTDTNDDMDLSGAGVFDFCMASSETVGWLNHLATELAYERAILAPRPPKPQGNQFGGMCSQCSGNGCNNCNGTGRSQRNRPFRRAIEALDDWFDERFYGDYSGDGITGGGGYNGGGYGYNGGGYGYNGGGYGYNGGGYGYQNNGYQNYGYSPMGSRPVQPSSAPSQRR